MIALWWQSQHDGSIRHPCRVDPRPHAPPRFGGAFSFHEFANEGAKKSPAFRGSEPSVPRACGGRTWPPERIAKARRRLIELGYLTQLKRAAQKRPALFKWTAG